MIVLAMSMQAPEPWGRPCGRLCVLGCSFVWWAEFGFPNQAPDRRLPFSRTFSLVYLHRVAKAPGSEADGGDVREGEVPEGLAMHLPTMQVPDQAVSGK